MSAQVTPVEVGRGAWNSSGVGGTLSTTGKSRGAWYALTQGDLPMIGYAAARAARLGDEVDLNAYAVHRAVVAIQQQLDVDADGVLGPNTADALAHWQAQRGLKADGVLGPKSARALFTPVLAKATPGKGTARAQVARLAGGHVTVESQWDAGAVGVTTPDDVGLGQVNGPAHPQVTLDERLDPVVGLGYVARLVADNLAAFGGVEVDAVAAYNLGQGGARTWIRAGRPPAWERVVAGKRRTVYVRRYVDAVLAAAAG